MWYAPTTFVKVDGLVLKHFIEEDSWGERNGEWMEELALAETYRLTDDPVTIEVGTKSIDQHLLTMGRIHYLVNSLLQVQADNKEEVVKADEIMLGDDFEFDKEMQGEEFEQGEISEDFREEEYDGFHLEMRLIFSGYKRERDVDKKTLRMRDHYLVRGGHLFIRDKRGPPRRVICGRNRQIDVITTLHDGPVGGHKSFATTIKKVTELYFWEGMYGMIRKYCESCVLCQIRSPIRCKEPLHPRYIKDVGAVIHLDLLAMPLGLGVYNYIFDARDNLTGFVDGKAIRTKTGAVLADCIKEYYLRYPFVVELTIDRGSEFMCGEVKELLDNLGIIVKYTTRAHPQANAPVERGHSTITNLLAKWTTGKPNLWPKFLRTVFFVENITVKRITGYAPATLWYGRHATFPIESFLKTWRRQDLENDMPLEELLDIRARQATMTQKGGMTGPSRIIHGREGRKKMQLVMKDSKGMSVYKEEDNLRIFLREFEEHAFRREWSTRTMLEQVAGLGECNEVIDEVALECLGWLDFKAGMWAKYGDLARDEIEDDISFDDTNLEDFEDSINLCSEKRRWGERKMMEQVMRRIAPREYEAVKRIKEESDTRGSFLVKMRKAYPLEVQRQKKKQLLQEQGLWIGKRGERIERRAQKENRKNITTSQQGNDEDRAQGGDDSIKEDKTQIEEHDGKEVEGNGKAGEVKKGDEKVKGKEKDSEENEMAGPSGTAEEPTSNEPPKERGSRRWTKEKRQRKEKENRECRNWVVTSLRENELPSDAHWSLKLERKIVSETVISSKLATGVDRLIRLNQLLRDDCEWILEGEAEVESRLRKVVEEKRKELEVLIQELQDRMKEKTELFTQGVASHVHEILKEIQRLRAREEKRDLQ
ncbi:hypothetical protein CBR_g34709 [Chara braunii]|uniref:Integrase catalytic domain-containing protein n=1 Tax=Chara braunii TaxID=69332 RepID=A0A388JYX5_CHABU|nr:hypothetical protein CBR_g34709 [Chara braunii]|eukprot:GBG63009.1 hypothetical protein CBR_g34709 [Chara braunii]